MGATMMSAPAWNAAAVTLKDSAGHICFAAAGAAAGTVSTAEDTAAALTEVTESRYHTIARMSCFLDREIADLGFDEILLTDVGYPTTGPLDKIDYNGADRAESIRTFLEELRSALAEYDVVISIELPAEVLTAGTDDTAGLVLADIAPLVDRIYAVTTADQIPALTAAVTAASEAADFAAELTAYGPDVTGSCLILPQT